MEQSLESLKAKAYDIIATIQNLNLELQKVNEEMRKIADKEKNGADE